MKYLLLVLIALVAFGCNSITSRNNSGIYVMFSGINDYVLERIEIQQVPCFYFDDNKVVAFEISKADLAKIHNHDVKSGIRHVSIVKGNENIYVSKWFGPSASIESITRSLPYYSKVEDKVIISMESCTDKDWLAKANCSVKSDMNNIFVKEVKSLNKFCPRTSLRDKDYKRLTRQDSLPSSAMNN